MGRSPSSFIDNGVKKGPWTSEEDHKLVDYIQKHGHGSWTALSKLAGLKRCGKSCRLRWTNYLRPDIKRGKFSKEEEETILYHHTILGNKWSAIATHLPGRTDNEIKNFFNTHLKKKLIQMGIDPVTHQPRTDLFSTLPQLVALANLSDLIEPHALEQHAIKLQAEVIQLAKLHCLNYLLQSQSPSMNFTPPIEENQLLNNEALFSIEKAVNSQLLHHPSITSFPFPSDPQVPFNFQTHLNSDDVAPPDFFEPLPVTNTFIINQGDTRSKSTYGGGDSSTHWTELLFEQPFMNEFH